MSSIFLDRGICAQTHQHLPVIVKRNKIHIPAPDELGHVPASHYRGENQSNDNCHITAVGELVEQSYKESSLNDHISNGEKILEPQGVFLEKHEECQQTRRHYHSQ